MIRTRPDASLSYIFPGFLLTALPSLRTSARSAGLSEFYFLVLLPIPILSSTHLGTGLEFCKRGLGTH